MAHSKAYQQLTHLRTIGLPTGGITTLDNHNSALALFISYSKAFDHVDHATVKKKMAALGVHPFLLKWLHSYLLNRQQRVKVGNVSSEWIILKGGIPQGT
jgi:hypothetical protein